VFDDSVHAKLSLSDAEISFPTVSDTIPFAVLALSNNKFFPSGVTAGSNDDDTLVTGPSNYTLLWSDCASVYCVKPWLP